MDKRDPREVSVKLKETSMIPENVFHTNGMGQYEDRARHFSTRALCAVGVHNQIFWHVGVH